MRFLVSSFLLFAPVCDLSAEPLCDQASPLLTGSLANCDGILMPKPWVEECVLLKDVVVPKCKVERELCMIEIDALNGLYKERRIVCETTIAELELVAREAAGLKPSLLDSFVPWLTLGLASGLALGYLVF